MKRTSTAKPFTQSLTIRFNAFLAALGVLLVSLPDVLTQALAVLGSAEVQQLLAVLPPRAKEIVDVVVRVLGVLIAVSAMLNGAVRMRTTQPVAKPKLPGTGFSVMIVAAVMTMSGCATVAKIEVAPIDCAAVTSPKKANEALADGQIIRIAARDLVATLYPSVLDDAAVQRFHESIDEPFTAAYAKARAFVEAGRLEDFKGVCEAFAVAVDALLPYARRAIGGAQ